MSKLTKLRSASYAPLGEWAYQEITTLRAQLAEVTRERDDYKQAVDDLGLTPEEARAGAKRSRDMKQQLLATQAHAARLVGAIDAYLTFDDPGNYTAVCSCDPDVGYECEVCKWPALPHVRAAKEALSTPINLDALHEDRAEFIDDVANRLLTEVCFKMGSGPPYRKMLHDYINTLREQAAAHRAKKEDV